MSQWWIAHGDVEIYIIYLFTRTHFFKLPQVGYERDHTLTDLGFST